MIPHDFAHVESKQNKGTNKTKTNSKLQRANWWLGVGERAEGGQLHGDEG